MSLATHSSIAQLNRRIVFPEIVPTFPEAQWTVPAVLEHQARTRGDAVYLKRMETGEEVTFAGTFEQAQRLAGGFRAAGVGSGDRIVFFLHNSIDHLMTWFASAMLGAVDAPINTAYVGDFLLHQMNLVKARFVVVEAELFERIATLEDRLTSLETIIVRGKGRGLPDKVGRFRVLSLDDLREGAPARAEGVRPQDPGTILYTSGTTGPSKGVILPHAQLFFFAEQTVQLHRLTSDDVMLAPVPFFHASGRLFGAYTALISGARNAMYEKFSGSRFVERLHESGATACHMLGAMMFMIQSQPPSPRDRGHRLRSVFSAPTAHEMADAFVERFGVSQIVEGLGQTEVCQPVLTPPGVRRPVGAAGVVMSQYFEARVVDPATDEEVPDGQVGEYVVRPKRPWIINSGYENMPEKSLEAMRNLWFHTGDAVRRDAEGWIYFIDRMKDCIRRRGENVSSHEVEAVIQAHPDIVEAAALAVKADPGDPEDEIMVCVVRAGDAELSFPDLVEWSRQRLPEFAVPRYFRFVAELPKTANDKVRKAVLREEGITKDTYDRAASSTSNPTGTRS